MSHYSRFSFLPLFAVVIGSATAAFWLTAEQPAQAQKSVSVQKLVAMPSPGTVRVIAQKVRNDAERVEWRWTIVTERNWSGVRTTSHGEVELYGGDITLHPDTPNQYDLSIMTRSGKDGDGKPRMYMSTLLHQHPVVFHGPESIKISRNGNNSTGGGEDPLKKAVPADKYARALFTGDKILTLPVKLPLYERTYGLDGTGKVRRNVSYLIIPK